jgi:hypothetical protein
VESGWRRAAGGDPENKRAAPKDRALIAAVWTCVDSTLRTTESEARRIQLRVNSGRAYSHTRRGATFFEQIRCDRIASVLFGRHLRWVLERRCYVSACVRLPVVKIPVRIFIGRQWVTVT